MKQGTASTVWLTVGLALFYFLFNAVAGAQGWPFNLPGIKFEGFDHYAIALVATPIGLAVLSVLLWIGAGYARRSDSKSLKQRLPVPFKLGDPDSAFLHAAQLGAFVAFPAIALVSLYIKYLGGQFCRHAQTGGTGCGAAGYITAGVNWQHFAYVPFGMASKADEFIYQGKATYWPFWEAIGITAMWLLFVVALAWFLIAVFRSPATR
ncbi:MULTISPECIES: hypothetical protein [Paraburkholderia]|uniref:Uncharacterized protein n=1 Tax=Paraburkholderia madseniana TaxID=2599607 RepID=A0AAP5BE32_9BURK|nr:MULTISPECIES: hypothetical protein [Paraburkholderia]MCX4146894.1 hypothetical protein [Paraburkholderia madseniana]MDN7149840.1 hypothetical protein [Paraburkholderia sp. WS6]MDQ6408720.1 hypothetical protein [Paraburkholderia madseniana]